MRYRGLRDGVAASWVSSEGVVVCVDADGNLYRVRHWTTARIAEGVTRLVVDVRTADHAGQWDEMSALAERFALPGAG